MYTKLFSLFIQMVIIFGLGMHAFNFFFGSSVVAFVCSALMALSIYTLDKFAIASDLKIDSSVISHNLSHKSQKVFLSVIRLLISLVFAIFLGTAVELTFEKTYLTRIIEQQTITANQHVTVDVAQYGVKKELERIKMMEKSSDEINKLNKSIASLNNKKGSIEQLIQKRYIQVEAENNGAIYEEKLNGGCVNICEAHKARVLNIEQVIAKFQQTLSTLNTNLEMLEARLSVARTSYNNAQHINVIKLVHDYKSSKSDQIIKLNEPGPLDYHMALISLYQDENVGKSAVFFSVIIKLVLIVLELMPLIIHMFFVRASEYQIKFLLNEKKNSVKALQNFTQDAINIQPTKMKSTSSLTIIK